MKRIAVIGAGMAGLACARPLHDSGFDITVFDKGRGLGGRLATRRAQGFAFDHGAQYVTARDPAFRAYLDDARASGNAGIWTPGAIADADGQRADSPSEPWFVGVPGMSGLVRPLTKGLTIRNQMEVQHLDRPPAPLGRWRLTFEDGQQAEGFDAVLVTAPAPQAVRLLKDWADISGPLEAVRYAPCWALMIVCEGASQARVYRTPSKAIAWAAANASKPGRPQGADQWVIHASPAWSAAHDGTPADTVAAAIWDMAAESMALPPGPPLYIQAHFWRYALTTQPLGRPCLWDPELGLGVAGDGCLAPRVEAAWQSGTALAAAVAGTL